MNSLKVAVAVVLTALAVFLLVRGRSDPLADGKHFTEYELADREAARQAVERALAAIARNDMKTLFSLMERKDRMIFDSEYAEGLFARNDFTPAKIADITGLKRQERDFAAVDVHSERRGKNYRFLLAPVKGGYAIVSIAEK